MSKEEDDYRRNTLDKHVDEKFVEIYFLAKDEYDIGANTRAEKELFERLERYKSDIKAFCKRNYGAHI